MSDVKANKTILYKNPNRKESDFSVGHYTPQYQKMGLEPKKIGGNVSIENVIVLKNENSDTNNPRTRVPTIRQQPYAESVPNDFVKVIPNVGNSMDHTWSGVDGEIIDDLEVDPNIEMIDNNLIITDELEVKSVDLINNISDIQGIDSILNADDGQLILLIDNITIFIGNKDQIVELASSLVFGEHDICEGKPVPIDNITILKKMPIKVGLFLE